ncbi:gp53-like domain-containing protein [Pseudomonas urmiensis]|uniref:gp53-like domain-containing protein n=1 Tax=Pseudomonas urmiensis TaxID=2745493 RepID=UPI003CB33ED3
MDYPKSTPNVGLVGGKFVDENAGTGQPGSLIPATWGNAVTDELLAVITAAGLEPSESDLGQLQKAIQGLAASDVKRTVRVTTTGAIALSGVQTIDGVAVVSGDRVLVKDQTAGAQNGIYTVSAAAWVRALDMNESAECTPGHLVLVENGAANAGSIWQLSNITLPTLGTTSLVYARMYGKTGVAAGTYRSVTVDVQGRVTAGSNPTTVAGYGINDVYTQTQVNNLLGGKADKSTTLGGYGINNAYTQTQVNNLLNGKADKATTLGGYGITDSLPVFASVPNDIASVFSSSVTYQNPSSGHQNALGAAAGCVLTISQAGASGFQLCGRDDTLYYRGHTANAYGAVRTIYHSGNFNPAGKADKATTLGGYGITDALQVKANFVSRQMPILAAPTAGLTAADAALVVREAMEVGATQSGDEHAPGIGFYWLNRKIGRLIMDSLGALKWQGSPLLTGTIASQAETEQGLSETAVVTPKRLRLGFAASWTPNGYLILPTWLGGFVCQWGTVPASPQAGTQKNFVIPFPNKFLCMVGSPWGNLSSAFEAAEFWGATESTFFSANQANQTNSYFAIGY